MADTPTNSASTLTKPLQAKNTTNKPAATGTAATATKSTPAPLGFWDQLMTAVGGGTGPKASAAPAKAQFKPSPIKEQHKDDRGTQPDYAPLKIVILEGAYGGKSIDLGLAIEEISQSQEAEWSDDNGDHIRTGANFTRLSARTFSISVSFYDVQHDISHLVENLAHLQEITDGSVTPPTLLWVQGDARGVPVVCTSYRPRYSNPLPGVQKGFRQGTVDLEFKMLGGKGSANALGAPLTSTPLLDYKRTTSLQDRQKEAERQKTELLLAPCLGQKGSQELTDIIEHKRQDDETSIQKLSPESFVQGSIAGIFSAKTLGSETVKAKLKKDLATVFASSEDGIGIQARPLAEALLRDDPTGLTGKLQEQYENLKKDYDITLDAISKQNLGKDSSHPLFDGKKNPTALKRFNNFGHCGQSLRQVGAPAIASAPGKEDAQTLKDINEFLKTATDAKVKEAFSLKTESEVRALKSGYPYTNKAQFLQDSARNTVGITGYVIWNNFTSWKEKNKPSEETPSTPNPATPQS